MKCIHCKSKVNSFISLGKISNVNDLDNNDKNKYKLNLGFCINCKLFQNTNIIKAEKIFNKYYPYISSNSKYLKKHFLDLSKKIKYKKGNKLLEIGSNDGSFLNHLKNKNIKFLGVEPSKIPYTLAKKNKIETLNKFFDYKLSSNIKKKYGYFDIIFSANTMAHSSNLNIILKGIDNLLSKKGNLYIENVYLFDHLKKKDFSTFYHEHVVTYSVTSLVNIYQKYNLYLKKIEFNNLQNGSFFACFSRDKKDHLNPEIQKIIENETKIKKDLLKKNLNFIFKNKINKIKKKIIKLNKEKKNKLCIYGASAKAILLINLLNLSSKNIIFVIDNISYKIGKFIPGTKIPIISPEKFNLDKNANICLLFTKNITNEILLQHPNKKIKFLEF